MPGEEQAGTPDRTTTDEIYTEISTPKSVNSVSFEFNKEAERNIKPNLILYTSVLVALLQPLQSGWSTSQTNLTQYNGIDQCNARPLVEGMCLMFPGHSRVEWTFAVNAWIFGGMIGPLFCGHFSDLWGRKKLLFVNCGFLSVGAVIQAAVSNIWAFAVGRVISGIASGVATGTLGSYINELSPPHLRNILGLGLQISVTMGILLPAIAFFFANTSSGWRYLAGFPIILAALCTIPRVSSQNVYGEENVQIALNWLESSTKANQSELAEANEFEVNESLFSPRYRLQLSTAILLSCAQQLSGINAVCYYSSSIFADAGISDSRIGTLIIDFINVFPGFAAGALAVRFCNRQMILWGIASMCVMAVCMTNAFLVDVSALSIIFTAFCSSLCIGINWLCNLVVGVAYSYISDALDDYAYLPFVVLLVVFYLLALKLVPETSGKSSQEIQADFDSLHTS
ncbi:hypothetical protein F441_07177 [Phytophthora nicotianae CJ01A1]|uniref:Major facilitator superfamily (MFS) profile domain-containing protein n=1 Tax=Phytophthora nicotianae CJ01A1 TaxID=1317063 RepID=W2X706_PHYNI|nr:hypothetical protein F441_07177 [Phytophthora nicotianae CJ01A1]